MYTSEKYLVFFDMFTIIIVFQTKLPAVTIKENTKYMKESKEWRDISIINLESKGVSKDR